MTRFVVFCCGLVPVSLTHIPQGYFTGTGRSYDRPRASEVTLKDMDKCL